MTKRDIFSELVEGFDALAAERAGKLTLRRTVVESRPVPAMSGADVRAVRTKLNVSQSVFARQLRIAERTVANWADPEPDPQAVVCTAAEYRRMLPLIERIQRDLKSQLIAESR